MTSASPIRLLLPALFAAAVLSGCGKTTAKEPEQAEAAPVEVIRLKKGGVSSELKLPGELIAFQNVDLYAKVNSFVRKLHADVGSQVREGTLLATLEAPEVTSQLAGAESRLKSQEAVFLSSKATYERLLETSKTPGTVSPNDLDIAFAKQQSDAALLESARATHREIADNRNYLEIRAPFSGVITARNVSTGAYVGPSGKGSEFPLFSLVEQQKLRLVVSLPEAYTGYTNPDAAIRFSVRALPGKFFEAKMSRQSGALDARLRAQRIEMDVPNQAKTLLPGMVAEVSVPLSTKDSSLNVPVGAVLNAPLGLFVIKVTDGKAVWVPVTMGRNDGVNVEVIGNISEGDLVVRHANEEIRDMSTLKNVKEAEK
ncbi:efflux RND transporter periplasmic adaptor subunit [Ravibacter arvi]|uniref:efflux RND transporter periplasmic adaptor subunit n=1 Tax=Ravibacter arvi TaxID=2051041 RepID=UPI0031F1887C